MSRMWGPRHAPTLVALLVAGVVVGVVAAPVAVHAAGQLVTIVDSSTNSPVKVIGGALRVDGVPARPVGGEVDVHGDRNPVLIPTTTAKINLTDVSFATYFDDTTAWMIRLYQYAVSSNEGCGSGPGGGVPVRRSIGTLTVDAPGTGALTFSSTVVLKPFAGAPSWCVVAFPSTPDSNDYGGYLSWNGSVASGTFPPPGAAPGAAPAAEADPAQPVSGQ